MIKIENAEIFGIEAAVRGMRNPMNSWNKSDSVFCTDCYDSILGQNDLKLMRNLVKAGEEHAKFMRMIHVQMDIIAPLYWWKEFDTYKVGTVSNSCSTMHKIAANVFALADFSHEHLQEPMLEILKHTIHGLNDARNAYLTSNDKLMWWQMIQLLPSSYNQRRTVDLNYAVLRSMYRQRKNHKLDEWRSFCKWMTVLPYSELITMEGKGHEAD